MNNTISVYELLGLIKDGKAPKKIKYDKKMYEYKEGVEGTGYCFEAGTFRLWFNYEIALDVKKNLNRKIEILEEDKSIIEKINGGIITSRAVYTNFNDVFKDMSKSYETIDDIIIKLNKVIDYINRKENNDKH